MKIDEFEFPDDLYYSRWHTWARIEEKTAKLGLDDFGQHIAGEIVTARIRRPGPRIEMGRAFATIETSKWVGAMRSPLTGTIIEVNRKLTTYPEVINRDPYGEGWMVVLEPEKLEEGLKILLHGEKMVECCKADIENYKATGRFEMPP